VELSRFPALKWVPQRETGMNSPRLSISYLLARNARVEEDLVDQLFNSSEKTRVLLLMANFGKEGRPEFRFEQHDLLEIRIP
jgi:hypothetical protein